MGQNQPAFLLAQLGAHPAAQFAERLEFSNSHRPMRESCHCYALRRG
jgi:hypothetical protein